MTDDDRDLLQALDDVPDEIATIVVGLTDAQLRWKPDTEAFSILENVAHMRDLEIMATTVRVGRIRTEVNPSLEDFDGSAVARASNYNAEALTEALGTLTSARRTTIATLRELGSVALLRRATFAGDPTTLAGILALLRAHDAEHLGAIRELAADLRGTVTAAAPIGS
jgi:hypothetical protein